MAEHRAATVAPRARLTLAWERATGALAATVGSTLRTLPGYAAIVTSVVGAAQIWQPLAWITATVWLLIIDRKLP